MIGAKHQRPFSHPSGHDHRGRGGRFGSFLVHIHKSLVHDVADEKTAARPEKSARANADGMPIALNVSLRSSRQFNLNFGKVTLAFTSDAASSAASRFCSAA